MTRAASPILIIAPHALDEVLGCGGVIALYAAKGCPVHTLILNGDGTGPDVGRRKAAAEAAHILGAQAPRFAGFHENRSDTVPLADVITVIERAVYELRPRTVYVSHAGDLNIDHQTAFRAAATALRPVPGSPITDFYGYEVASSTDWAPPGVGEAFRPTCFVEITPTLARKMQALQAYASEMREEPHARSIRAIENLARARGASVGVPSAEAFSVLRMVARA